MITVVATVVSVRVLVLMNPYLQITVAFGQRRKAVERQGRIIRMPLNYHQYYFFDSNSTYCVTSSYVFVYFCPSSFKVAVGEPLLMFLHACRHTITQKRMRVNVVAGYK